MKKVNWPPDGKPACFSDLSDAVREVVKHCYTLKRKNKNKDVDWKGPELPECMRVTCLTFDEALQADKLEYQRCDQGRSAIDVIIGIALQLGLEQGRRMQKGEMEFDIDRLEEASRMVSETALRLKDHK